LEEEFVIGYKKRYSFTKEFVNSIIREMELSKIKPLIPDKVKLQQFVSKTSIEIFLEDKDIAEPIKKGILTHEKQLKDNLNIRVFTDFKDVPIDVLSEQIKNLLNSTEDMSNYARLIKIQAKEFFNVLKELGFSIKF
jgi:sucrose-6-phosphate hydrolase SacC (GH32 family)